MTFNPALVLRKFKGKALNKQAPLFQSKVAPHFPLKPLVTFAGPGPTESWGQTELKVDGLPNPRWTEQNVGERKTEMRAAAYKLGNMRETVQVQKGSPLPLSLPTTRKE